MQEYVSQYVKLYPELMDLVAAEVSSSIPIPASAARDSLFEAHLSMDEILPGIKAKKYFRGTIHPRGEHWSVCYVILHDEGRTVHITGAPTSLPLHLPPSLISLPLSLPLHFPLTPSLHLLP